MPSTNYLCTLKNRDNKAFPKAFLSKSYYQIFMDILFLYKVRLAWSGGDRRQWVASFQAIFKKILLNTGPVQKCNRLYQILC